MTIAQVYTLMDVVDEALEKNPSAPTREVVNWLQTNHRATLDDNKLTIESEGLGNIVRSRRKRREPGIVTPEVRGLCLDFGLEVLDLPEEISVPTDIDNLPFCPCKWPALEDATVDDLDKHLLLLDAQIALDMTSRANMRVLRQAAAKVIPARTDIPLKRLRVIARERNGL